ncbi:MAG: DUF3103 family protein [Proteobacteria bacterium]|nr:MAG: DUF3103 family protein [Pseudomonadota bacterium]
MKNLNRFLVISVAMSSMIACGTQESNSSKYRKNLELSKQISLLTKKNDELTKALAKSKGKVSLKDLAANSSSEALKESILGMEGYEDMVVTVPVAEHREKVGNSEDALVVVLPESDDKDVKELDAIDANGNEVKIPVGKIPSTPVITIGRDESLPKEKVDAVVVVEEVKTPVVTETPKEVGLKLESFRFTDTHEPWFKGSPEMYVIISYMDKSGKGVTKTVELEGADKKNTTYNMEQILHLWDDNKYQFVDMAFMEHDSNMDFTGISEVVLSASAKVTSLLYPTAAPAVTIVSDILSAAMKAIPNKYFVDNDDYVDTINLVEKDQNSDRTGVKGEVTATFVSYDILLNK